MSGRADVRSMLVTRDDLAKYLAETGAERDSVVGWGDPTVNLFGE